MIGRVVLGLVIGLGPAASQGIDPTEVHIRSGPYTPPSQVTLRVETNVVEVPATVRDRSYQSVSGLRQEDFVVTDSGRKQQITGFTVRTGRQAGTAAQTADRPPRLIALVFDDISFACAGPIPPREIGGLLQLKNPAEALMRTGLPAGDQVSIFTLYQGQVAPFTTDREKLSQAIRKVTIHSQCPGQINKLELVADIVRYMSRLTGERLLLLTSYVGIPGSPLQRDEIVRRAIQSGVTIHALNSQGVGVLGYGTMGYLAYATGGDFFHNNNDFGLGLRRLATDAGTSYVLSYHPDRVNDGRYHELRVRVPAGNHYEVQARPGYFALTEQQAAQLHKEREIDKEVTASGVRTDAPATFSVVEDMLESGEPAMTAVAHIDVGKLRFRTYQGRKVQKLTFIAALMDEQGNVVAAKEGIVDLALSEGSLAKLSQEGINCILGLQAPAGTYRLRAVLQEANEGKMSATMQAIRIR